MKLRRKLFSTRLTRNLAGVGKKVLRKPHIKAKRDAITLSRKIQRVQGDVIDKLAQANTNPGRLTSDMVEGALKNPLTVVSIPTPVPTTLVITGEAALRSKVPIYRRVTDLASNVYKKSPLSKIVESGVNTAATAARAFSIPEGHYSGVKDINNVPTTSEVLGKGLLYGGGAGAAWGLVDKNTSMSSGAVKGAKLGIISSLVIKNTINKMHNPMTRVKYQKVDRRLRKEFGKFKSSYISSNIRDLKNKKLKVVDYFAFNDIDNVLKYKINVSIRDNQVTMYTLNLSENQLNIASDLLDSFCKKYFGMKYSSSVIDSRTNTYSVIIVFTNYDVISNFLLNLSRVLNTKINLMNNNLDLDSLGTLQDKYFSKVLSKQELNKILTQSGSVIASMFTGLKLNKKNVISSSVMGTILASLAVLGKREAVKIGVRAPREDFDNSYLLETLRKLRYVRRFDFTVGDKSSPLNISMSSGRFLITCPKEEEISKKIDESVWKKYKKQITRSEVNGVIVYAYTINSRNEFETILKILMSLNKRPNIFE